MTAYGHILSYCRKKAEENLGFGNLFDSTKMIQVAISESTINSFLYSMWSTNAMTYSVNSSTVENPIPCIFLLVFTQSNQDYAF